MCMSKYKKKSKILFHCPIHITEPKVIFTSLMECFDDFDLLIFLSLSGTADIQFDYTKVKHTVYQVILHVM